MVGESGSQGDRLCNLGGPRESDGPLVGRPAGYRFWRVPKLVLATSEWGLIMGQLAKGSSVFQNWCWPVGGWVWGPVAPGLESAC